MDQDELSCLGTRLREARETRLSQDRKGYSVRALAARLDISPAYLSQVERGLQRPTEQLLTRLAAALGLEPDALLVLARRVPQDVVEALTARPALAEAVRALRDLPDLDLTRAIRHIRDGDW